MPAYSPDRCKGLVYGCQSVTDASVGLPTHAHTEPFCNPQRTGQAVVVTPVVSQTRSVMSSRQDVERDAQGLSPDEDVLDEVTPPQSAHPSARHPVAPDATPAITNAATYTVAA